jgi:hypothetical protein
VCQYRTCVFPTVVVLFIVGVFLVVWGMERGIRGLKVGLREANSDTRISAPLLLRIRQFYQWLIPQPQTIHLRGIDDRIQLSDDFWLEQRYEPLGTNLNVDESIAQLDERVRYVQSSVYSMSKQVKNALSAEISKAVAQQEEMQRELTDRAKHDQEAARRVLGMEIAAFLLINSGAVILAAASVLSLFL